MDHGRPDRADQHLAQAAARGDRGFHRAGFRITVISEPEPDPAARELFPEAIVAKPCFLCFLFFVLQAD
ncbi:hypothetical protein GCM10010303_09800 [Streptomyces purpurascens]|nr:hypothetical protein GCM10010303_09800 [Streptomyces purpurascens]